jgi:hypothetical protein
MENKAVGKSELHRINLRYIRGFTGSEESDDNCEAHGNLGGCYGNDEEKKNVAFVGGLAVLHVEAGKRDEREVGGCEHQLEAHENNDEVATD